MKNSIQLYRTTKASCKTALTIGNFDGVHKGHQHLIRHLVQQAKKHQLHASVLTFTPHPREFFAQTQQRPELIPTCISTLRDKVTALAQLGIKAVYLHPFNYAAAHMEPETFIKKILIDQLNIGYLYVGEDFRFGYRRQGDINLLLTAAKQYGFIVDIMPHVLDPSELRYSSTGLRQALALGNVEKAKYFLGKHYGMSGHVIHGKKIGRTLGIPTLNMPVMRHCALRSGVYIASVHGLSEKALPAVASLGVRPTVESAGEVLLEAHILHHSVSAYGKLIQVDFHHYIRDEEKFADLSAMMVTIQKDIHIAQHYFNTHC